MTSSLISRYRSCGAPKLQAAVQIRHCGAPAQRGASHSRPTTQATHRPDPHHYACKFPSPRPDGCCLSCGEPLTPGNRYHCEPCVRAAWQVLREVRGWAQERD